MKRGAAVLVLLGMAACASGPLPPRANRLQPDHAPTPFSAAQIRQACPDGSWIKFKLESPGAPAGFLVFRFLNGGAEETTVASSLFDADDNPMGEPSARRQKWTDLQSHASFPEARVRIDPASFDTFRGRLDGWLYTVNEMKEGKAVLTRYAFARSLPGPPVLLEEFTDGTLTRRMTMVGRGTE